MYVTMTTKTVHFETVVMSYCSFVGEFSESNLGTHFWFLATLLKLSATTADHNQCGYAADKNWFCL